MMPPSEDPCKHCGCIRYIHAGKTCLRHPDCPGFDKQKAPEEKKADAETNSYAPAEAKSNG